MGCMQWHVGINSSRDIVKSLQWRHNDHDSVSNHQPHGCLLNRLFGRRSKKTSKLRVTGLCAGNSPGPVNSPHKGPVTRKMFPFDDVIMVNIAVTCRYDFQGHICLIKIRFNLYNVHETSTKIFASQVITGYRIVSCADTFRYDFQRYNFQNKANIIGLDVNGMYAVTCGYQLSPGYRNVSIAVACRYDFQGHICQT